MLKFQHETKSFPVVTLSSLYRKEMPVKAPIPANDLSDNVISKIYSNLPFNSLYCFESDGKFEFINNLFITETINLYLNDLYIPENLSFINTFKEWPVIGKKFSELDHNNQFCFENRIIPTVVFSRFNEEAKEYLTKNYGG